MPAVVGRSPQARTITITLTDIDTALTADAGTFHPEDAGRPISGQGIPAGSTLASVESDTEATLSDAATESGEVEATLPDVSWTADNGYGFIGWSPKSSATAADYKLPSAGANDPEKITDPNTSEIKRYTRA